MRSVLVLLLPLLLLCAINVAQQAPLIKFGWTRPLCGDLSVFFADEEAALTFWVNYTNANGGINVNGTAHQVQLIMCDYPPPTCGRTLRCAGTMTQTIRSWPVREACMHTCRLILPELLYERLATVDQVHAFFGPSGDVSPGAYAVAERHNVRFDRNSRSDN